MQANPNLSPHTSPEGVAKLLAKLYGNPRNSFNFIVGLDDMERYRDIHDELARKINQDARAREVWYDPKRGFPVDGY